MCYVRTGWQQLARKERIDGCANPSHENERLRMAIDAQRRAKESESEKLAHQVSIIVPGVSSM
jgi:hypothetical protein